MHHETMMHTARCMLAAADRLLVEVRSTDDTTEVFLLEALVLNALAAEVGLKSRICAQEGIHQAADLISLIRSRAGSRAVHDLQALFGLLDEHDQRALRQQTLQSMPTEQSFLALHNQDSEGEMPNFSFQLESSTFESNLHAVRSCFEEWRYRYELPRALINATFLRTFARVVVEPGATDR